MNNDIKPFTIEDEVDELIFETNCSIFFFILVYNSKIVQN